MREKERGLAVCARLGWYLHVWACVGYASEAHTAGLVHTESLTWGVCAAVLRPQEIRGAP